VDLAPRLLARIADHRVGPDDGVTIEMLELWEQWARAAVEAVNSAAARPKQTFAEPPEVTSERGRVAARHLSGEGIEIGALHNPLPVPKNARVRYVDKVDAELLCLLYPEIANYHFVPVEIVDDGEKLETLADGSLDFVVSNHFLEHCQDPLGTLLNQTRVLRPGGVLYLAVPDCRRTFDRARERTSFEHLWRDHSEGPGWSRADHYREWSAKVNGRKGEEHEAWWRLLDALSYSIHFHVWAPDDLLEILLEMRRRSALSLSVQEFVVHGEECILVARKE